MLRKYSLFLGFANTLPVWFQVDSVSTCVLQTLETSKTGKNFNIECAASSNIKNIKKLHYTLEKGKKQVDIVCMSVVFSPKHQVIFLVSLLVVE